MTRTYWAHFKTGNKKHVLGPFETREQALEKVKEYGPVKQLSTGYGAAGAWFDIKFHTPVIPVSWFFFHDWDN
jgi:hypothetical protein